MRTLTDRAGTPRTLADVAAVRVPDDRHATAPAERRGRARDRVRLLVADGAAITHTHFTDLPLHLDRGDLLVVNTSPTLPAALSGWRAGNRLDVHVSTHVDGPEWIVELRRPDGTGPILDAIAGARLSLQGGGLLRLGAPWAARLDDAGVGTRLWRAEVVVPGGDVVAHLHRHGRPITYAHAPAAWPLEDRQTIFANGTVDALGSAEMVSAGRPFSHRVLAALAERGVGIARLRLHAGVASLDAHEDPHPERLDVPADTAAAVNATRAAGRRVVAVGTTSTRALETATGPDGVTRPVSGWTDLVLSADRPARAVDGIISGWHDTDASHLHLLASVVGEETVARVYGAAVAGPYLWHEFGDSALLLRPR